MRKVVLMMLLAVVNGVYVDAAGARNGELAIRDGTMATLLARLGRTAAWLQLGYNDSLNFYVDLATIRKAGDRVNMWYLIDFSKPDKVRLGMSITTNAEYDCKEPRVRQITASSHSGNMGRDEVVFSNSDPGKWEPVSPALIGSIKTSLWKFACGKQ